MILVLAWLWLQQVQKWQLRGKSQPRTKVTSLGEFSSTILFVSINFESFLHHYYHLDTLISFLQVFLHCTVVICQTL